MKRLGALTLLAGLLAIAAPSPANAQMNDCNIICSPVFVNQSSAIITNFVDAPEGIDSDIDFLARFTTAFGTQWDPLFLVALVQWTPFKDIEGQEGKNNAPVFVYGPGLHVLGGGSAALDMGSAGQYFALDLLPLMVYSFGGLEDESVYTHKLTLEADAFLHIGKLIDPNNRAPYINSTSLHVIVDFLTDALGDAAAPVGPDEKEAFQRWVLIVGLTTPIAPIPGG